VGVAVRVVAFDLMDTVVRDPFREALEVATGLGLRELFARRDPTVYPAFECGEIDEAAYWAHYAAAGITVDPDAFHRIRREGIAFLPGMAELLDDLAGLVERVTASNYPVWVEELARDHLQGRFERIIASCHLGVRKPERGFFDRLVDELGVAADEVCFVDDRHDNVEAARQAGLRAHRFTGASALRGWLADHDVPVRRKG
jgi:FMN hydrolase / 5-amino-6-(5-phospho-D-ribitylamino)uracil phosphatase